jgi:ABC-2 type transport system ATP-binding protein
MARGADLLILDEPMEGLDPAANEDVLRELVELSAAEGTTVFFSSHQIADVEQISDHICIINHGASLVSGALDDMKGRCRKIQITFPDNPPPSIQWAEGAIQIRQEGRMISMLAFKNVDAILAQGRSFPGALAESFPLTLKEVFLAYIRSC